MSHTHDNHNHDHDHDHDHDHGSCGSGHAHSHGKGPVYLYIAGLVMYIGALFLSDSLFKNILFIAAMLSSGYHVIFEGFGDTITQSRKQRKFVPNIHILMTLAALGASLIGDFSEGALLILIFAGAHFLEDYAENKSRREITNLMNMNPTEARLMDADGNVTLVDVSTLKIGNTLQVLNGDQIPTDGEILTGYSAIDESSINGESIPAEKTVGDIVFASTINGQGSFTMRVTKDSKDSVFAKILELVNQSQSNMSKTATKIKKIEPKYVTVVLVLVPIFILMGPYVFNWSWNESFYRGMVFLTVASPCALAASATPATLSAISNLAKRGVLFKGGSYLTNLSDIKAVAFDKTGTLTQGKPSVTDVIYEGELSEEQKSHYANIIIAMERSANHPLAKAILEHFGTNTDVELEVENVLGQGLIANFENKTYKIGKPETFKDVNATVTAQNETLSHDGKTVVYFSEDNQIIAMIAMMDVPNKQSKLVIDYLKSQGIHTVMITGDSEITGQAVGRQLGIDEVVGNVLPENKAAIVQDLQKKHGMVAMLGDGVNDAPALVNADIGVAMGDGTDIAIDVADAVLMQNDLTKFEYAHRVSKKLDKVVWQNIIFSMGVVLILVVMNIMGNMSLPIGVLVHEGSTLVVLFNGLRMLTKID